MNKLIVVFAMLFCSTAIAETVVISNQFTVGRCQRVEETGRIHCNVRFPENWPESRSAKIELDEAGWGFWENFIALDGNNYSARIEVMRNSSEYCITSELDTPQNINPEVRVRCVEDINEYCGVNIWGDTHYVGKFWHVPQFGNGTKKCD